MEGNRQIAVNWHPSGRAERREEVTEREGGEVGGRNTSRARTSGSLLAEQTSEPSCKVTRIL